MADNVKMPLLALCSLAVVSLGIYYGYIRNEDRCYKELKAEINAGMEMLERWTVDAPDYVDYTPLELAEFKVGVSETSIAALLIKQDPYRSACDYYVYGMQLRKK